MFPLHKLTTQKLARLIGATPHVRDAGYRGSFDKCGSHLSILPFNVNKEDFKINITIAIGEECKCKACLKAIDLFNLHFKRTVPCRHIIHLHSFDHFYLVSLNLWVFPILSLK